MIPLLCNIPAQQTADKCFSEPFDKMRWTCKGLKTIVGHVHLEHVDTVVGIKCSGVDIKLCLKRIKKIFILSLKCEINQNYIQNSPFNIWPRYKWHIFNFQCQRDAFLRLWLLPSAAISRWICKLALWQINGISPNDGTASQEGTECCHRDNNEQCTGWDVCSAPKGLWLQAAAGKI